MTAVPSVPPDPVRLAKRELRDRCRRRRDSLGEAQRTQASERIVSTLAQWGPLVSARVAFIYMPMPGEVDVQPLMRLLPHVRWAVPRLVREPVRRLAFHAYEPGRLIQHRYGMLEPDPALPEVAVEEANVIIVPGLGYTRRGHRLGYGGGYYDRLLAAGGPAVTVGVCFEALVLEDLPLTAHDRAVEYLVTEDAGIRTCRTAG
ncbi:MAG: 5-formyltetrahydrofolate cyclo-ligase [Chloroflexi bacterium]|nr:5-formyltetrahydrofolate cyclo-ligase [Chloroflexota bacterium]